VLRTNAGLFLEGLLGDEQRKRLDAAGSLATLALAAQAILGRRDWDADACGMSAICHRALADDDAVLVIDETGFLKQGKASCGVARQ